jgi:hypothetical protein
VFTQSLAVLPKHLNLSMLVKVIIYPIKDSKYPVVFLLADSLQFHTQLPHLFQPATILLPFQIPLDRWDLSLLYLLQLLDLIRPEATLVQLTVTTTLFPIKSISLEPILTVRLMSLLVFPLQFTIK